MKSEPHGTLPLGEIAFTGARPCAGVIPQLERGNCVQLYDRRSFAVLFGSALATFSGSVQGATSNTSSWSNVDLPQISGISLWTLMDRHQTGWITQDVLNRERNDANYRRLSLTRAPDGRSAYKHTVLDKQVVGPVGFSTTPIRRQNSLDRAYLLRYRHWLADYPGSAGKYHTLEGGRGWTGDSYRYKSNSTYGSDGWAINVMHPKAKKPIRASNAGTNRIGGLGSHARQPSPFGTTFQSTWTIPLRRWLTVDVVAKMGANRADGGYIILVDGVVRASSMGIMLPHVSAANCKTIQMMHRLMDGGVPKRDMHIRPYQEWFCDFEIWRGN